MFAINMSSLWFASFQTTSLAQDRNAQHGVQRTAGILRDLQAFFWLQVYTALRLLFTPAPRPPANANRWLA